MLHSHRGFSGTGERWYRACRGRASGMGHGRAAADGASPRSARLVWWCTHHSSAFCAMLPAWLPASCCCCCAAACCACRGSVPLAPAPGAASAAASAAAFCWNAAASNPEATHEGAGMDGSGAGPGLAAAPPTAPGVAPPVAPAVAPTVASPLGGVPAAGRPSAAPPLLLQPAAWPLRSLAESTSSQTSAWPEL